MGLLAFLFRAIVFLFILRLAGLVLRAFLGGFRQGARPDNPQPRGQVEELVKDPICGVHTARSSAIVGRYQGTVAYFCSDECAGKAGAGPA